jgi:hypothetical protein
MTVSHRHIRSSLFTSMDTCRPRHLVALVLVVAASLMPGYVSSFKVDEARSQIADQNRDRKGNEPDPRLMRVKSADALRARSEDHKNRALRFDRVGLPLLQVRHVSGLGGGHDRSGPVPSNEEFFETLACAADLIVVGKGTPIRVLFNTSETALFTDYRFGVEQQLWPTTVIANLEVSVYGGVVEFEDGTVISATDGTSSDLTKRTLLFLKRIPNARSYSLASPSFLVELGNVIFGSAPIPVPPELRAHPHPLTEVTTSVTASIARCFKRSQ